MKSIKSLKIIMILFGILILNSCSMYKYRLKPLHETYIEPSFLTQVLQTKNIVLVNGINLKQKEYTNTYIADNVKIDGNLISMNLTLDKESLHRPGENITLDNRKIYSKEIRNPQDVLHIYLNTDELSIGSHEFDIDSIIRVDQHKRAAISKGGKIGLISYFGGTTLFVVWLAFAFAGAI